MSLGFEDLPGELCSSAPELYLCDAAIAIDGSS
jgi:hypothetical protein